MAEHALERAIQAWLDDEEGDVTYAELVEERWAVRMRQTVREATTVWWSAGDYSVAAEAYVIPAPPDHVDEVYRLALRRNLDSWRCHFAVDGEGAVVVRGRVAADSDFSELDSMLGEIYQMIELTFRPMARLAFPGREKTP